MSKQICKMISWAVQQYYSEDGWKIVYYATSKEDANERLKEYRLNQPHIPARSIWYLENEDDPEPHFNPLERRKNLSLPRWASAMEGRQSTIVSIGIVTNENPNDELAMNREPVNREIFKMWIRRLKLSYEEIIGDYGTIEHPFLIYNCTRSQLITLAREGYQKAVIFGSQLAGGMRWEWIEYRDARADYVTTERRYEWEFSPEAKEYFSQIMGRKFKMPFFDPERRGLPSRSRYGTPSEMDRMLHRMSAKGGFTFGENPEDFDYDPEDDRSEFAEPHGRSALRTGKRIFPCPNCKEPNRLTRKDVDLGYQCDECADRVENSVGV